jgi:hypothetical protein
LRGWAGHATVLGYEKRSDDVEGLDFIPKSKPSIGIEAKGLNVPPPKI